MDILVKKIEGTIFYFIVYTVLFYFFIYTLKYSLPFVLAFIFSQLLLKPTLFLINKFKIKGHIASLIATLTFVSLVIIIFSILISTLVTQSILFYRTSVEFINKNTDNIDNIWMRFREYYKIFDEQILPHLPDMSSLMKSLTDSFASFPVGLKNFVFNIPYSLMVILFTFLSTYFFTEMSIDAKSKVYSALPDLQNSNLVHLLRESRKMLFSYVRSFLTVIGITFIECFLLLSILRINNALILSIIASIADILPVLGVGSVLVPTALFFLLTGDITRAILVFCTYGVLFISRQILEPKIVSSSIGVNPIAILISIFIGLKIDGITGMFYLIFMVVGFTILRKVKAI